MSKSFPRAHIAEAISELRAVRGKVSDMQIIGYGLIGGFPDVDPAIKNELIEAMELIDHVQDVCQEAMTSLFAAPTPIANDDKEQAA
jgi:hypothetical protein